MSYFFRFDVANLAVKIFLFKNYCHHVSSFFIARCFALILRHNSKKDMATKKELEAKKELARMYYMQGETQKSISAKIEISETTISKWVDKEGWAAKRAGVNITRPELVNKSLAALNKILDQVYESEDMELISALPDKLSKFASAIEKLDKKSNIVSTIDVFMAFSK